MANDKAKQEWLNANPGTRVNRAAFGGQFEEPKRRPKSKLRNLPTGKEMLERIQSGQYKPAPTEYLSVVRKEVSDNCEELIEMGARIRPLMDGDKQVGWIRGVHPSERKRLKRWIKNPDDFILNMILLGTAFTAEEVEAMSSVEVYELIEIIRKMTDYDMSLTPYMAAFSCTQMSENLWFSKGVKLTSYEDRAVTMPDGKRIQISTPPDQVRMWASLCTYREQAKKRLDENWNAVLIVRPQVGKGAEPVVADLKRVARSLETDSLDPWSRIVKNEEKKKDDGWAHGGGSSIEELMREMNAMVRGDKHEQVMDAWGVQMEKEETERLKKIDEVRKTRNTTGQAGVVDERVEYFTEAEMRERQLALKQGKLPPVKERNKEREKRETFETNVSKLRKYR
jgi:hypothetical protein